MLRLPSPDVVGICSKTLGLCLFLPGPQTNPACVQSLSKSFLKVDPSDFCSLLSISCKQFSKDPIPTLTRGISGTSDKSRNVYSWPYPCPLSWQNLKDIVLVLSFTLCSFDSLDDTTLIIWDSFLVNLVLGFWNLCWSCLPVLIDIIAQTLCCRYTSVCHPLARMMVVASYRLTGKPPIS